MVPVSAYHPESLTGRDRRIINLSFFSRCVTPSPNLYMRPSPEVCIFAPVPTPKDKTRNPYQPLPDDSPIIAAWRERIGTRAAKTTYKLRAATAECVNAQARTQEGVQQSTVRSKAKNRCLALWVAIAHNLWVWIRKLGTALRPQPTSIQKCAA